ncbi:MAG: leucyl/phenylalanyl-tRNA--protein transferase [Thermodesulfobacteria bacterium]|nr:leucyl/phenylalanyl-tRNA--protein transferase [Thermodesulfobacteriota bacterium]
MPVFMLDSSTLDFPPVELAREDGLLAVGGDLSVKRLITAYRRGIFPWYNEGEPILWWSPHPRLVLFPDELHVSKRLERIIRQGRFRITFNTDFRGVIEGCATAPRRGGEGTWITEEMKDAYERLHRHGYAHSVEAWEGDELVGGLYGVLLGKVFFGESMFSRRSNSSKVAFVHLVRELAPQGLKLIDCQVETGHLRRFGARLIPRSRFTELLDRWASPSSALKGLPQAC